MIHGIKPESGHCVTGGGSVEFCAAPFSHRLKIDSRRNTIDYNSGETARCDDCLRKLLTPEEWAEYQFLLTMEALP